MEKSAVVEHAWDNHHPIHWEEITGVVGEGGPAHPDDTCGGVLQLRWRIGSPWLLDHL